jgi:O-antigen/teichoic acid export membrane protein
MACASTLRNTLLSKGAIAGLFTSRLARASGLMFASGLAGGLLGYAFQVLMGRLLSIADYGLFATFMALLTVIAVPFSALSMIVTRKVSAYRAKNQPERIAGIFWWVNKRLFWAAIVVTLGALPFSPLMRDYFRLDSLVSVWIFLFVIFFSFFSAVNPAILQGQQNFRWLAASGMASPSFRIIFCVVLVLAGFKLNGALMGVVFALAVSWLVTFLPLRRTVVSPAGSGSAGGHLSFKSTIPVLIANLAFTIMTQLDMVLVNHYFDSGEVGIYAAASVLGKAVMYLPGAIAIAMFPMVAENDSREQSSAHLFFNALALTAGLSTAGAMFYFLFADWIVPLLYGQKYQSAAELLRYYGFAMLPMTLVLVAEYFLIAKGRVIFAYVMMLAIPFVLLAAQTYHSRLMDMVYILGACGWGLALAGFSVIGLQYWRGRKLGRPRA